MIQYNQRKEVVKIKIYRVEMMDSCNYGRYISGFQEYKVIYYDIYATNKEQALSIAKQDNPNYYINESYVQEVTKKEYTTNEKDMLILQITKLELQLEVEKKKLKKFRKGG